MITIFGKDNYLIFKPAADGDSAAAIDDALTRFKGGDNVEAACREAFFWQRCQSAFRGVDAAGGVVTADDDRKLIMLRDGMWDLPKGMVEAGETTAAAALREVREETGLAATLAGTACHKTYHIYDKYGGWHLKTTYWYAMRASSQAPLMPQTEEGITLCQWVDADTWKQHIRQTYKSLGTLLLWNNDDSAR